MPEDFQTCIGTAFQCVRLLSWTRLRDVHETEKQGQTSHHVAARSHLSSNVAITCAQALTCNILLMLDRSITSRICASKKKKPQPQQNIQKPQPQHNLRYQLGTCSNLKLKFQVGSTELGRLFALLLCARDVRFCGPEHRGTGAALCSGDVCVHRWGEERGEERRRGGEQ
eukprot:1719005-Rhodomonas_salina.1